MRARAERAQRRLLRDAVDAPAVAGRALRARARAGRCARRRRRASRRSAPGARSRASTPGSRARGYLMASTAPAHDAVIDEILAVGAARSRAGAQRGGRARALRLAAVPPRAVRARRRDRPAGAAGARACARGCARRASIHERSRVRRAAAPAPTGWSPRPRGGRVRAGAAVLAVNAATRGVRAAAGPLSVTSSHIVLTEPVPGRARGDSAGPAASASPTPARSCTTSAPRATAGSRSAGAEAGSRRARGSAGASRSTPHVAARDPPPPRRDVPRARGPRDHPRLGRPDRRLPEPPARRSARSTARRVHYAFGFTGNGVGPSHLAGRVLAALACGRAAPTSRSSTRSRSASRPSRSPSRAECWCAVPFYVRNVSRKQGRDRSIR